MIIPDEEWRVIERAPGYEVSSLGRIRNIKFGRLVKPQPDKDGYFQFTGVVGSKRTVVKIHRAVLIAFKGQPPSKLHLSSHEDGNKQNNRLGNLEWKTQKQNLALRHRHGTNGRALTKEKVSLIRTLRNQGKIYKEIADIVGVTAGTACKVALGKSWWPYDYS